MTAFLTGPFLFSYKVNFQIGLLSSYLVLNIAGMLAAPLIIMVRWLKVNSSLPVDFLMSSLWTAGLVCVSQGIFSDLSVNVQCVYVCALCA